MKSQQTLRGWKQRYLLWGVMLVAISFATLLAASGSFSAHAATTLPTEMNFQGRITNSAGSILANGTYNMRFKIWDSLSGGSSVWSEDRLVSLGQGVTVTNGQFSVQLGEITTLSASVFSSSSRYFEIELPTPGTATSSSPTWTEGAMTPRNQLVTSAYAYNAETLDGIDGASFAQLAASNAFTNANSIDVSHANAFQVKSGATSLFNVDTSGSVVTIGQSDTTAALFVLDTNTSGSDPTNVAGGMYYNSSMGKFRCSQAGAWTDCIGAGSGAGLSANNTFTGTNTFQNTSNSTSAFAINNQSAGNLFKVDTTNAGEVTILGNNSGETGAWQTNADALPAVREGATSVVANGYVYEIGGYNGTTAQSTVYYAKLNADGSTGAWQTNANALPAIRAYASSVVSNGYVYVIGGTSTNSSANVVSTVYYAKLNADGSTGAWQTNANALTAALMNSASVTANGYVYVIGGTNVTPTSVATIYYAKINADGSVGTWTTNANALTGARANPTVVTANGYVYVMGGQTTIATDTVYHAQLSATNGSIGTWTTSGNTLPATRMRATSVVSNGYVYVMGGGITNTVYYTKLKLDGTIDPWQTSTTTLPASLSYATSVMANGYAYVMGGTTGSTVSTVYYSRLGGTLKVGGNLDLVGLQGQNLADGGSGSVGSTGGSITAGNITGVGTLQVQEDASFADSVSVTGNFNAGNGLFAVDTESSVIRIGSSIADATAVVLVFDTKNTTGDPTGVAGAVYYNSFLSKFRCYEGTAWRNCLGSGPVSVSTATQAPSATVDTYLTGSMVPLPAGGFQGPTGSGQDGTFIRWKVLMSKTAAGTAASTFTIRIGTAGTTSDTARCTAFGTGTATAAVDWAEVIITVYATAGGASTTLNCSATLQHGQVTTGFSNQVGVQAFSTQTSFDSTAASTKAGLSLNVGTGSTVTVQKVDVETANL